MSICKEKPDNLPPLDVIGLEPSDQSSYNMTRGGSGRRQASNSMASVASPPSRQASTGLDFVPAPVGKSGTGTFPSVGQGKEGKEKEEQEKERKEKRDKEGRERSEKEKMDGGEQVAASDMEPILSSVPNHTELPLPALVDDYHDSVFRQAHESTITRASSPRPVEQPLPEHPIPRPESFVGSAVPKMPRRGPTFIISDHDTYPIGTISTEPSGTRMTAPSPTPGELRCEGVIEQQPQLQDTNGAVFVRFVLVTITI